MGVEQVLFTSLIYMAAKKLILPKYKLKGAIIIFIIYAYYLLKTHSDMQEPNVYEKLQIPRYLSTKEINQSYKKELITKHPDKSASPNAEKEFREMKELYDHIKSPENRKNYEKFGRNPRHEVILSAAGFYISWIFVSNGIYFSKISRSGRILLCIISIIGVLEAVVFPNILDFNFYWPKFTVFEVLTLTKAVIPSVCFLLNSIENLRIQDVDENFDKSLNELVNDTGKEIIQALISLQGNGVLDAYVNAAKNDARAKYNTTWRSDIITFLIFLFVITR